MVDYNMQFVPFDGLKSQSKKEVLKFLLKYEHLCVQLVQAVRNKVEKIYVVYMDETGQSKIYGVICLRKTYLHCLPFCNDSIETALQNDFIDSLYSFIDSNNIELPACVNGTDSGTKIIMRVLEKSGKKNEQLNLYNLMRLNVNEFLTTQSYTFNNDEKIIRCKSNMNGKLRDSLQEIQNAYEIEEVIPKCIQFNPDVTRLRFSSALRNQYILAILLNGEKFISKGGTNAIGYNCVQIGGVFTLPEYRNNHYSYNLMQCVLRKILSSRKKPVLFVRKDNLPALKLYSSLKFVYICDYTIAYYK